MCVHQGAPRSTPYMLWRVVASAACSSMLWRLLALGRGRLVREVFNKQRNIFVIPVIRHKRKAIAQRVTIFFFKFIIQTADGAMYVQIILNCGFSGYISPSVEVITTLIYYAVINMYYPF